MIVESNLYCVTDLTTVRTQKNVNANRLIEMRGLRPKTFIKAGNFQLEVDPTIVHPASCGRSVGDQRKLSVVNNARGSRAAGVGFVGDQRKLSVVNDPPR